MEGPPSSAAGPSQHSALPATAQAQTTHNTPAYPLSQAASASAPPPATYYTAYPSPWQYGAWRYPYNPSMPPGGYNQMYSNDQARAAAQDAQAAARSLKPKTPSPSPAPVPPPSLPRDWDGVIKTFLGAAGLLQALRGFEMDMLVMNEDREREVIPKALEALQAGLLRLKTDPDVQPRPLEEKKLDYVHPANNLEAQSPTSLIKSISAFLAKNRARNDASNRAEFLQSLAEKHALLAEQGTPIPQDAEIHSCARLDAKAIDRDVQMKYDIARNEDGPLRKTLNTKAVTESAETQGTSNVSTRVTNDVPSAERHPGLDERLRNIEQHFGVNYVPAPPASLLDRLRHLEDHIIRLEKEYPPWAALHFNQPKRGWPPPPRSTPILVDPRTTVATLPDQPASSEDPLHGSNPTTLSRTGKPDKGKSKQSSLSRAIMEKLEVQKAKEEMDRSGP